MATTRNVIGPRLRAKAGMSLQDVAARLQIQGWEGDRSMVWKIENRRRKVAGRGCR
jgi:transcriptional regulator with XRE-family HTH domain